MDPKPTKCCSACGTDTTSSKTLKKGRRLLSSPCNSKEFSLLCTIVEELLDGSGELIDKEQLYKSYVCQSCFRSLTDQLRLREKMLASLESIKGKAMRVLPALPKLIQEETQSMERSLVPCPQTGFSISQAQRVELERQSHPQGTHSPPVTVSHYQRMSLHFNFKQHKFFQVVVHYKNPRTVALTPRRRNIIKPLARKSHTAAARNCLKDGKMRKHVINEVGRMLHKEIVSICSDTHLSLLENKSNEAMKSFSWEKLVAEFVSKTPILISLLKWCTKTKKSRANANIAIGLVVAILCRFRRPKYSLVQRIVSLILYSGHASKQVSSLCCIG